MSLSVNVFNGEESHSRLPDLKLSLGIFATFELILGYQAPLILEMVRKIMLTSSELRMRAVVISQQSCLMAGFFR